MTSGTVYFHDRTLVPVNIGLGLFCWIIASLNLLPFFDGKSPSSDTWAIFILFILIGLGFLLHGIYGIRITDDGLTILDGWKKIHHPYSSIKEVFTINTPRILKSGPALIEIPRSPKPVSDTAAYEASAPWNGSKQSVLILFRGATSNFILPHPQASEIAKILNEHLK